LYSIRRAHSKDKIQVVYRGHTAEINTGSGDNKPAGCPFLRIFHINTSRKINPIFRVENKAFSNQVFLHTQF
jgi:hypothetical protein